MPRLYTFIYHHPCTDGFAAAWLFKKFLDWGAYLYKDNSPNVKFVPRGYDIKSIEDSLIEGREVYIVDFSFPREELIRINSKAEKLIVLDHHKTAEENCKGLDFCIFDMNKCGSRLLWEYFESNAGLLWIPPDVRHLLQFNRLIDYIEDRDLWRNELHETK